MHTLYYTVKVATNWLLFGSSHCFQSNPPADIPFSVAALLLVKGTVTVDIATFREKITGAHLTQVTAKQTNLRTIYAVVGFSCGLPLKESTCYCVIALMRRLW